MTNTKNLQSGKAKALATYKLAKAAFAETVSRENIKGDPEKWIQFCEAKKACMLLGVII